MALSAAGIVEGGHVRLLPAPAVLLQLVQPGRQRNIQAAVSRPPLVERSRSDAMHPTELRHEAPGLSLLQDGGFLAIGEPQFLRRNLIEQRAWETFTSGNDNSSGGLLVDVAVAPREIIGTRQFEPFFWIDEATRFRVPQVDDRNSLKNTWAKIEEAPAGIARSDLHESGG
jgi:hypothetical protein